MGSVGVVCRSCSAQYAQMVDYFRLLDSLPVKCGACGDDRINVSFDMRLFRTCNGR